MHQFTVNRHTFLRIFTQKVIAFLKLTSAVHSSSRRAKATGCRISGYSEQESCHEMASVTTKHFREFNRATSGIKVWNVDSSDRALIRVIPC